MQKNQKTHSEIIKLKHKIERLENDLKEKELTITELKESCSQYRTIFESANDGIILHDLEGNIIEVNQNYHQRLGYTKKQMLRINLRDLVTPEFGEKIKSRVNNLKEKGVAIFESVDKRNDGTLMPVEVNARLINLKGNLIIQSIVRDISDRKLAEDLIEKTLNEKDLLLQGIGQSKTLHQMIVTQTFDIISNKKSTEVIGSILTATNQRLEAMDFIQNKINRFKNISNINIDEIIRSLVVFLHMHYRVGTKKIQIQRHIEHMRLNILKASPCVFIINELLTNCFKHAFPDGRQGKIVVKLKSVQKGRHILSVMDNGIGLNNDLDLTRSETIGFQIVCSMVEQLNGKLKINQENGTEILIRF